MSNWFRNANKRIEALSKKRKQQEKKKEKATEMRRQIQDNIHRSDSE